MSYWKDKALFDLIKVTHQVVVVVNDTVWARELACLFTTFMDQHDEISSRPSRKCRQLSIYGLQMKILGLCISMLCGDNTLRSFFATCTSRGTVTVIARNRLKTILWLVICSLKGLCFERMVLPFSRFFMEDPNYFVSMEQKNCHIVNISW